MSDDRPDDEQVEQDDLDGGLFEAFKGEPGESILNAISRLHGTGESVMLRETEGEDPAPIVFKGSEKEVRDDTRYQILGEIARGGIGIVYRARDKDLNRDVALKVLRPDFKDREDVIERFVEEAQVGGQLQHPGIVPVYALGMQEDGRPSFAMKLIKGRTLAELLETNPRGIDLLSVFEQVALTMAYSHSRNVIHRDLKPSNVMVGAFGEVQVVDWGFGKVIGRETKTTTRRPEHTIVATLRSGSIGSHSIDGSVMGTPAYMPPEQALGHVDELDERADVFALGAILCEILTGKAPYTGSIRDQLIAASQCRTDEALERLDAAEVADPLKDLTRDCLENESEKRPRNARVVADRIAAHFATNEERARTAELEAVRAETQAAKEQKKRTRTLALGITAAVLIFVLGGGALWFQGDKSAREARAAPKIATALREAASLEAALDYDAAVVSAQRAVDVARAEGVDDAEASAVLATLEADKLAHDESVRVRLEDEAFLADLLAVYDQRKEALEAPAQASDDEDGTSTNGRAAGTFADLMDVIDAAFLRVFTDRFGSVEASLESLRDSPHATDYAVIVGYWSWFRKRMQDAGRESFVDADWQSLDQLARAIDPENAGVWDALLSDDPDRLLEVAEARGASLPVLLAAQVGITLSELHRPMRALAFLKRWHRRHPDHYRLNKYIAVTASRIRAYDLQLRHAAAVVALRPDMGAAWIVLGQALLSRKPREAITALEHARRLVPDDPRPLILITSARANLGDREGAFRAMKEALALDPSDASTHIRHGALLVAAELPEKAIAAYREAVRLRPDSATARIALAEALAAEYEEDEALAELEKALELEPKSISIREFAAGVYREMGELELSLAVAREGVRLHPDSARVRAFFAHALFMNDDREAATATFVETLELDPRNVIALWNLSILAEKTGDLETALTYARRLVDTVPWQVAAHFQLARVLKKTGDRDGEFEALNRAIEIDPNNVLTLIELSDYLNHLGRHEKALELADRAVRLDPDRPKAHLARASAFNYLGRIEEALEAAEIALAKGPTESELVRTYATIAGSLIQLGRLDEALDYARENVELAPKSVQAHHNLAIALANTGDLDGAIESVRKALAIQSNVQDWTVLAQYLSRQGDLDGALEAAQNAVRVDRSNAWGFHRLGIVHLRRREFQAAEDATRQAITLAPEDPNIRIALAGVLQSKGDADGALKALEEVVAIAPESGDAQARYAHQLMLMREYDRALEAAELAIELDPTVAWTHVVHASLLVHFGDILGAEDAFRRAFDIDRDHPQAVRAYANLRLRRDDLDGALELAKRAVELMPRDFDSILLLGNVLRQRGDLDEAVEIYEAAIENNPVRVEPRMGLALAYMTDEKYEKMAAVSDTILTLPEVTEHNQAIAHSLLHIAYHETDLPRATRHIEKANELAGDNLRFNWFRTSLAQAYIDAKRFKAAIEVLEQALEVEPDNWRARSILGNAQLLQGELDEAISSYKRVIELNPVDLGSRSLLAHALHRARRHDEAIVAARKTLEIHPENRVATSALGQSLLAIGEFEEARDVLEMSVLLSDEDVLAKVYLARAHMRFMDYARALPLLEAAVALGQDIPMAHEYLSFALARQNDLGGAAREMVHAVRIYREALVERHGPAKAWSEDTKTAMEAYEKLLERARQRRTLATRLDAILAGTDQPKDYDEAYMFAALARGQKAYAQSLRLYETAETFREDLDDERANAVQYLIAYNAACEAALAGDAHHDDALKWMRVFLDIVEQKLDDGNHVSARSHLGSTRVDPDLTSVRDRDDLSAEWKAFWADHAALHERAREVAKREMAEAAEEAGK